MTDLASRLVVQIKADTSQLDKTFASVQSKSAQLASSFASNFGQIAKTLAIGLGAAFTGIGIGLQSAVNSIDELGDKADALGVTVQALQGIEFAAAASGVKADQLTASFARMIDAVQDASNGSKPLQNAFQQLGLDIAYIKTLNPERQFRAVSTALRGITDKNQQFDIGRQLFGRGFVGVLRTASQDIDGISKRMKALGLDFSDEQIRAVDQLDIAQKTAGAVVKGVFQQTAASLAAPAADAFNHFTLLIEKMGGVKPVAQGFAQSIIIAAHAAADAVKFLYRGIQELMLLMQKASLQAKKAQFNLQVEAAPPGEFKSIDGLLPEGDFIAGQRDIKNPAFTEWQKQLSKGSAEIASLEQSVSLLEKYVNSSSKLEGASNSYVEAINRFNSALDKSIYNIQASAPGASPLTGTSASSGFGVITSETGRQITTGNVPSDLLSQKQQTQNVNVTIQAKDGLFELIDARSEQTARKVMLDSTRGIK